MEKSKKISFTSIAIVVLAILLTVSLTMGGTLAWFANQNQAGTQLTMGNAVGVAVVDANGTNSMDRLSFDFNTGRNGELMLPGTQIDPDIEALVAVSNTNTILRAVITFEVSLSSEILADSGELATLTAITGAPVDKVVDEATGATKKFVTVPSSIVGDNTGSLAQQELYVLNQMYTSFFDSLQASAVYNGWVYRESNVGVTYTDGTSATTQDTVDTSATSKIFKGSARPASTKYYIAGKTQYANMPLVVNRLAGKNQTQTLGGTYAAAGNVMYNAFYFRGWSDWSAAVNNDMTGKDTVTSVPLTNAAEEVRYEDHGLNGIYKVTYSYGSKTKSEYVPGTGRQYFSTREDAATKNNAPGTKYSTYDNEYEMLEGTYDTSNNSFTKIADPLGYRKGDATDGTLDGSASTDAIELLNVAKFGVETPSATAGTFAADEKKDSWQYSGAQYANEDMMGIITSYKNGPSGTSKPVRIPLFTTSFVLPTTWTQDAFADRSIKLNITFQVMQADYLASGSSHAVSVELAESRFDDITIWAKADQAGSGTGFEYGPILEGQPYNKDVSNKPSYDDPNFWNGDYIYDPSVIPTPPAAG